MRTYYRPLTPETWVRFIVGSLFSNNFQAPKARQLYAFK